MYKSVSETALLWSSLTVDWFPSSESRDGMVNQQVVLGTYTSGTDKEYLSIGTARFLISKDAKGTNSQLVINKRIDHDGEVNRARIMPQNPNIIATASVSGDVYLFDHTKFPDNPSGEFRPTATLAYHTENGYGLSWNYLEEGKLLTSSDDSKIALWDVNNPDTVLHTFNAHKDIVNDVEWHRLNPNLFASVSDDKWLYIYDLRTQSDLAGRVKAHDEPVNSLAFSPFSTYMLATVSGDQTGALWDSRNLSLKLHSLEGHGDSVTSVNWHPQADGVLATAGADRRIILWDITRIGEEQAPDDAEDGAPELLFMHGGHTSSINDFRWNPQHPWTAISVSDDNIAQVWTPSANIVERHIADVIPDSSLE
jgi:histone-binding protein RBBP4